MNPEFLELLACPVHKTPLVQSGQDLHCTDGCSFPVVHGVPVLIPRFLAAEPGPQATFALAKSIRAGREQVPEIPPPGIVDRHVQDHIAGTNSAMYTSLIGRLKAYPIPDLPLPLAGPNARFLDIGCNWGRWCIAAAAKGYAPIGLDASLEAVLAAGRVSRQLGVASQFVVGDVRHLPFRTATFDAAFSYSVLQHLPKAHVLETIRSLAPLMRRGGMTKLHLLNRYGLRSLYIQAAQFLTKSHSYETRYWSPQEMTEKFSQILGPTTLEIDGYFMQGRYEDRHLFTPFCRLLTTTSHHLKTAAMRFPPLAAVADNLFVVSRVQ